MAQSSRLLPLLHHEWNASSNQQHFSLVEFALDRACMRYLLHEVSNGTRERPFSKLDVEHHTKVLSPGAAHDDNSSFCFDLILEFIQANSATLDTLTIQYEPRSREELNPDSERGPEPDSIVLNSKPDVVMELIPRLNQLKWLSFHNYDLCNQSAKSFLSSYLRPRPHTTAAAALEKLELVDCLLNEESVAAMCSALGAGTNTRTLQSLNLYDSKCANPETLTALLGGLGHTGLQTVNLDLILCGFTAENHLSTLASTVEQMVSLTRLHLGLDRLFATGNDFDLFANAVAGHGALHVLTLRSPCMLGSEQLGLLLLALAQDDTPSRLCQLNVRSADGLAIQESWCRAIPKLQHLQHLTLSIHHEFAQSAMLNLKNALWQNTSLLRLAAPGATGLRAFMAPILPRNEYLFHIQQLTGRSFGLCRLRGLWAPVLTRLGSLKGASSESLMFSCLVRLLPHLPSNTDIDVEKNIHNKGTKRKRSAVSD